MDKKITFEEIASGKWQARIDGVRISSALIVGSNGIWRLQGQRTADYAATFKTRIDAARYQLACMYRNFQTN